MSSIRRVLRHLDAWALTLLNPQFPGSPTVLQDGDARLRAAESARAAKRNH